MALLQEPTDNIPLETGFDDPVYESQIVFRKILKVMSEPGTIKKIKNKLSAPTPMMKATAAVCLTLMDFETKVDCEKHLNMPPKEIKRLISKADVNKDGLIDKKEFLDLVQNKGLVLSRQQQNVMRQYLKVKIFFLASQPLSRTKIPISKSGSILALHNSCTRDSTF